MASDCASKRACSGLAGLHARELVAVRQVRANGVVCGWAWVTVAVGDRPISARGK